MRKNGAVALDEHVNDLAKSAIFTKYPSVPEAPPRGRLPPRRPASRSSTAPPPPRSSTCCSTPSSTRTTKRSSSPVGLIQKVGDALPGLGIVAAVLGIIITMGHLDAGPEEIGHHVAAALVGTFLGILLCYGVAPARSRPTPRPGDAPAALPRVHQGGVLASLRGAAPPTAVEFGRKMIFSDERPSFDETRRGAASAARRLSVADPAPDHRQEGEGRGPRPSRRRLEGRLRRLRDRDDGALHGALAARVDRCAVTTRDDAPTTSDRHPAGRRLAHEPRGADAPSVIETSPTPPRPAERRSTRRPRPRSSSTSAELDRRRRHRARGR